MSKNSFYIQNNLFNSQAKRNYWFKHMSRRKLIEAIRFQIEEDLEVFEAEGSRQFQDGNYNEAKGTANKAVQLNEFLETAQTALVAWADLLGEPELPEPLAFETVKKLTTRAYHGRLERGKSKPQKAFRIPILEVLIILDGRIERKKVFQGIQELIGENFNKYDNEIIMGHYYTRWMNNAAWERHKMIADGLLKSNSPRGIWEISEAGRKYINDNEKHS